MIKRETYMSRIRPFIGTDLIKVMTGIRRCGKSVMPYTARYVIDHYCSVGQYSDKIYTGVANENEVFFWELPEF